MFFIIGWIVTAALIIAGILVLCLWEEEWGMLPLALGIVAVVVMGVITGFRIGAIKQAEIINARYGTDYTSEELFYAESTIKLDLAAKFGIKNVNEIGE